MICFHSEWHRAAPQKPFSSLEGRDAFVVRLREELLKLLDFFGIRRENMRPAIALNARRRVSKQRLIAFCIGYYTMCLTLVWLALGKHARPLSFEPVKRATVASLSGDVIPGVQFECTCSTIFQHWHHAEHGSWDNVSDDAALELESVSRRLGLKFKTNPKGWYQWHRPGPLQQFSGQLPYTKFGFDPVCNSFATFRSDSPWFRDAYKSDACDTQPRERALAFVLANLLPTFSTAELGKIHESSPNPHGLSASLKSAFGARYVGSQYSASVACGERLQGSQEISVDLERQCFPDATFDLVITQDVFEHIYDAASAFREIARTMKPGGLHVFTVPTPSKSQGTFEAAQRIADFVQLNAKPEIHGNPVGKGGALLTRQWGYDIVDFIDDNADKKNYVIYIESAFLGIEHAEYREVFVSVKKRGHDDRLIPVELRHCHQNAVMCNTYSA